MPLREEATALLREAAPYADSRFETAAPAGHGRIVGPDVVLRRYSAMAPLAAADVALLQSLRNWQCAIQAGQELECEGAERTPRLILSGWACRFRLLTDGRRMILGFLLPGDAICSYEHADAPALASAAALTDCRLLNAAPIWKAVNGADPEHAALRQAQRALALRDETYLLDHVVRLGRRTAPERVCHLLLELHARLRAVGLAHARAFPMPLTQETLADAVGLTVVHVNRTLQRLRHDGVIEIGHGRVTLLQPDTMAAIAAF